MNRRVVPRFHLLSDHRLCSLDRFPTIARQAVAGGVDAVHLREKELPASLLLASAIALREQIGNQACLFINDRVDIAMVSRADGVQLGETSLPVTATRSLTGQSFWIGRSIHDVEGARTAAADGADFVIAGHIYETASKQGQSGRGTKFIEMVALACSIPVIAIGGITPERVPDVMRAGAYGVAVISGILTAADPEGAARRFTDALERSV